MRRLLIARLFLIAAADLCAGAAAAHAFLDRAMPPVGGVVATAPWEVRLTFTEPIEPAFSGIELSDAAGAAIATGPAAVAAGNPAQLVLALPPLSAGRYKVSWHVVSVDTHRSEGQYRFEIRP